MPHQLFRCINLYNRCVDLYNLCLIILLDIFIEFSGQKTSSKSIFSETFVSQMDTIISHIGFRVNTM